MTTTTKPRMGKVEELVSIWDEVLGSGLIAEEGVSTAADYWIPLVTLALEGMFEGQVDDAAMAAESALAGLAALDLLAPDSLTGIEPGHPELDLVHAALSRAGLDSGSAGVAAAALVTLADRWAVRADIRSAVRSATEAMRGALAGYVPVDDLAELGVADPARLVEAWEHQVLDVPGSWSDETTAFLKKFGLRAADLYEIGDRLDRSPERLDLVVGLFMAAFCAECDPTRRQICVEAAAEIDLVVHCPLLKG